MTNPDNPAETILQKCNEMIAMMEKAFKNQWYISPSGCSVVHNGSCVLEGATKDIRFSAHAANNSAQLAKALKIVTEALEHIREFDSLVKEGPKSVLQEDCEEAIQKAALILKEGTL